MLLLQSCNLTAPIYENILMDSVTPEDFKRAVDKVLGEEMLPRVDESMRMFS